MGLIEFLKENLDYQDMQVLYDNEFNSEWIHKHAAETIIKIDYDSEYGEDDEDGGLTRLSAKLKKLGIESKSVDNDYEGRDEYYWVFEVTHNGESGLFRVDGWYSSYAGCSFDDLTDFYEVEKTPKTIYVYTKKV